MKTTLKSLWNRVPEETRPLAFLFACTLPLAAAFVSLASSSEKVAEMSAASEAQAAQVAQASDALQQKTNLENSVQSDCYQYLRSGLYKKGSLDTQPSWINGDVNSDFVVIQPFSAENGLGQRLSGTAVCSGSQGVVTSRQVDMR